MLNCKITIGESTYTSTEFVQWIKEKGMQSLAKDPVSLTEEAKKILNRYDKSTWEMSLVETWVKLERERLGLPFLDSITEEEVNEVLSPAGQLSSYETQRQIRYNTYSGIALTGISANFGKGLAYSHEGGKLNAITFKDKPYLTDSDAFKALLLEEGVLSAEDLITKSSLAKAVSKDTPTLKPEYHFMFEGQLIDAFVREERKLFDSQKPTNVFETVDTIINLAIDNVKEQKLHLLGITNANANVYLSMVGMGLPLTAVSRLFKTPVMEIFNEGARWTQSNFEKALRTETDKLSGASDTEIIAALELAGLSGTKAQKELENLRLNNRFSSAFSSAVLLDKVYVGQANDVEVAINNYGALSIMQRTIPVGEQLFSYAQIFSLLRNLPSKKWKLDSILDKTESLVSFDSEDAKTTSLKESFMEGAVLYFKQNDIKYLELLEKSPEAADTYLKTSIETAQKEPLFWSGISSVVRASFINRLLRKSTSQKVSSSASSVFVDNIPLRIPHVMAAYRSALFLRNLIEKAFRVHSPSVQAFAKNIIKEANIFSPFDKLEKQDAIQKEIIKFLGSGMKLNIQGVVVDLEVNPEDRFYEASDVVSGVESWAQKLIGRLENYEGENVFLEHLEISQDPTTGLRRLLLTSDKQNDEEVVEEIREGFRALLEEKENLAFDLFKYSILTEGLFYERSGLALVFPDSWAVTYSQALENRLNSILPNSSYAIDYNLGLLKDSFLYQVVRNNPSFVGYPREGKAHVTGQTKTAAGKKLNIYSGYNEGVYFDLMYQNTNRENMPKFIKFFSNDIFLRLDVESKEGHTYYVKVIEGVKHSYYNLDATSPHKTLNLTSLSLEKRKMVNVLSIRNNSIVLDTKDFEAGTELVAFDKSLPNPLEAQIFQILDGTPLEVTDKGATRWKYKVQSKGTIRLDYKQELEFKRELISRFTPERVGITLTVDNLQQALVTAKEQPNTRLITSNIELKHKENVVYLPIASEVAEYSGQEEAQFLEEVQAIANTLKSNFNYLVDINLLQVIENRPSLQSRVGNMLANTIGYIPVTNTHTVDETSVNFLAAVVTALKDNEIVSSFVRDPGLITTTEDSSYTHIVPKRGMSKRYFNSASVGSIIKLGKNSYGLILEKNTEEVKVLAFPVEVLRHIDTPTISEQQLLALIKAHINC